MPIYFEVKERQGYFVTKYVGRVTNAELLASWEEFINSRDWIPGLNQLVDLSRLEPTAVTHRGIRELAEYVAEVNLKNRIPNFTTSVFAPESIHVAISEIYSVFAELSPEQIYIFHTYAHALAKAEEN